MFLLLRITLMCTSCLSLQMLLPVIQKKKKFGAEIFNPQKLNVIFLDQNGRNYRLYGK
jgi:hypothetical protein